MRNIDLDSLEIFKTVVDFGSVTKAATQLNRVQSNITTRIQNLEERLGVQLFFRQGGRLLPSPEGLILHTYAERLLLLASEAEGALQPGRPKGRLRLGTLESTAASRLPPLLSTYHERNPDVQVELITGPSATLVSRVHRFELEAAFVAEPFNNGDLDTQVAFVEELVLIAPKGMAHAGELRELQFRTVIAFETGCSYRRILEDLLKTLEIVPERILELASYHAIVACVAAGSGIAILPRAVLDVVHFQTEVHVLPVPHQFTHPRTHLVWRRGYRSAALDSLRKLLVQQDEHQGGGSH